MAEEKVIIEIFSEKERGEECWSWCLKKDDAIVAKCQLFSEKDANRDYIKRIQTEEEGLEVLEIMEVLDEKCNGDIIKEWLLKAEIIYKDEGEDPAHQAKDADNTQSKGVPGS